MVLMNIVFGFVLCEKAVAKFLYPLSVNQDMILLRQYNVSVVFIQ